MMFAFNKAFKILSTTLHHVVILFTILFSSTSRAEESSILTTATVIGTDISNDWCPDPSVLISGFYKTYCRTDSSIEGDKEIIIDLQE